jgi:predicted PurR-regulated permease PerM
LPLFLFVRLHTQQQYFPLEKIPITGTIQREENEMNTNRQLENIVAGILLLLLAGGSVYLTLPFLPAILWATIFAVSSWPLYARLNARLRDRPTTAAALVTLIFLCLFLLPFAYVGIKIAEESSQLLGLLQGLVQNGLPSLPGWISKLPLVGEHLAAQWARLASVQPDFRAIIEPYFSQLGSVLLSAGASLGKNLLLVVMSLFLLFYLLKEGSALAVRLERMVERVGGEAGKRLLLLAGATMSSVVYGTLGAAIAQGVLAAFGFWLASVPGALLLGALVFAMGIVPVGLTTLVMLPVAVWLFASGAFGWGIFMVVWTLIVSNVDNYIRPMFISKGANLPFIVVFIGVLGGVATGGFLGLFVGSTLLAVFYTILVEWSAPAIEKDSIQP